MKNQISKRNGQTVAFDKQKIFNAIRKANTHVTDENIHDIQSLTDRVVAKLDPNKVPSVEAIQDMVEEVLIQANYAKTAKAYILYRAQHSKARQTQSNLMDVYKELTFKSAKDADLKRENANIDADTPMGTMLKYGSESSKYFINNYVLPDDMATAHTNGDIHIHDLDFYALTETCCQIDLLKLFKDGFQTGHGSIREPKSINVYAALACIAIQSNQNEMHGGQGIPNFDYAMAPGVAKTFRKFYFKALGEYLKIRFNMKSNVVQDIVSQLKIQPIQPKISDSDQYLSTLKTVLDEFIPGNTVDTHQYAEDTAFDETNVATMQSMESLIHNLNTMHSRAGAQVPFSSINYGTDTSSEGRMVIKNLLLATIRGMGNGETPIFPVQIFKVKDGVNYEPGDPNYDLFKLAIKTSAKRLFPNFSFLDAPFNLQYYKDGDYDTEVAYMGCRTRVMGNTYDKTRETTNGRGNLSFTSINLPRIAIEANKDIDKLYELLDQRIELVIAQLLHRYGIQSSKTVKNYPFLMGQGVWIDSDKLKPNDTVAEILKHGSLSVGFIGLAEALTALTGNHHGENTESQALGLAIIGHMREKMDEASEHYQMNFTLLATPAEGLSGRFVKMDQAKYGVIHGVTDKDYYTNSFHVPVGYQLSAHKKIKTEAPYHNLTNAGHISYVEFDGDMASNLEAYEKVVRAMKESGIGYGSVNHPVDRDPICGYNGIIGNECPQCHRIEDDENQGFERIRRITGYLVGTVDRWNDAKRAEEKDRVKHGVATQN